VKLRLGTRGSLLARTQSGHIAERLRAAGHDVEIVIVETAGDCGGLAGKVQMGDGRIEVLAPFYKARPTSIYGGSNEIQRNILSRYVLNLPS